jgi:hypothetical protein
MGQLALSYTASFDGRESWAQQLEAIRAAVSHLGPKEVLYELNISKSTLSETLRETNNHRWAAEWTHKLLRMLYARHDETCDRLAGAILDALVGCHPRFLLEEVQDLSDAELAAAYRAALKRRGGDEDIARIEKKRGRR